jgi:HSP20 family protein
MKKSPYFQQLFPAFGSTASLFTDLDDLFSDANSLFERSGLNDAKNALTKPLINYGVKTADGVHTLEIPVPGISQDQVSVTVIEDTLHVKIQAESAWTAKGDRKFTIPADADPAKIKAAVTNGLLTVTIPKSESAKPLEVKIL